MKKEKKKKIEKPSKKHVRLNFNAYFVLSILLFVFALSQALILFMLSMSVKQDVINYKENGNIDYKVFLKQNEFYDNDYLEKDMIYVASLIKNIDTTFNYTFSTDTKSNINYDYEIVGELIIYDSAKENTFFKKSYPLTKQTKDTVKNAKGFKIEKNISIDYVYYNSLANKFKKSYGVSSKSDFIVKLKLNYQNDDPDLKVANKKELTLTVPLSENEVNINLDNSKINGNNQVLGKKHVVIQNSRKLVSSAILACISIFFLVYIIMNLFELRSNRSRYDLFIKKILREYDRLIVNTTTAPDYDNHHVIDVSTFQELLDVHDNLGIPIMYYVNEEHKKCTFYVNHDTDMFVLKINAEDLDN